MALICASLWLGLMILQRRYWLIWLPGRVAIAGHSNRLVLFRPEFERSSREIFGRLSRADQAIRGRSWEVRFGNG
jgi:hypothetical protein